MRIRFRGTLANTTPIFKLTAKTAAAILKYAVFHKILTGLMKSLTLTTRFVLTACQEDLLNKKNNRKLRGPTWAPSPCNHVGVPP